MRARMALSYAGMSFEVREILLRFKPDAMLALSAKGTVPVLMLPDGKTLDESLEVMHWAIAQRDPDGWMNLDTTELAQLEKLISMNDGPFKFNLDRYKYSSRYPEKTMQEWRAGGEEFLRVLENALAKHKYLIRDTISFADVAVFPFVRQFAHVDLNWFKETEFVRLIAWYEGFMVSDLFNSIMKKYPIWTEEQEPIFFHPEVDFTVCSQ